MELKNRILGCIAITATLILAVSAAQAQPLVYTWINQTSINNNWNDGNNWDCNGCNMMDPVFPSQPNHIAEFAIPAEVNLNVNVTIGELHTVNNASALISATSTQRTINLQANSPMMPVTFGRLIVEAGSSLDLGALTRLRYLDTLNAQENSVLGGTFALSTSSSILRIEDNVVMGPDTSGMSPVFGTLEGVGAELQIEFPGSGTRTYTNQVTIEGDLTITTVESGGTAVFLNDRVSSDNDSGVVRATDGGTIVLDVDLDVSDSKFRSDMLPLWAADGSLAVLEFNKAATGANALLGEFRVENCGEIHFNASVETTGPLDDDPRLGAIDTTESFMIFFTFNLGDPNEEETIFGRTEYGQCNSPFSPFNW